MTPSEPGGLVTELEELVASHSGNALAAHGGMRIYDAPLMGVAVADDPLFARFQEEEVVGSHHRRPGDWLPGARAVVAYFLPFAEEVRRSNRRPGLPSEEWVSARIDGELFNNVVRASLVRLLEERGGRAVAPALAPDYAVRNRRANWSERHAAHAAGLGQFGLSKSLITARGCAGRYGSVITDLELTPTTRAAGPFFAGCDRCRACIGRCPAGAISAQGKDTAKCAAHIDSTIRPRFAPRYGCAKCQNGVPCEYRRPEFPVRS
jgi:epoxyqueuosine reductase QueG